MPTTARGYVFPAYGAAPDIPVIVQQAVESIDADVTTVAASVTTRATRRETLTGSDAAPFVAQAAATAAPQTIATSVLPAAAWARRVKVDAMVSCNYSQSGKVLLEVLVNGVVVGASERSVVGGVPESVLVLGRPYAVAANASAAARTVTVRVSRTTGTGVVTTTADAEDNVLSILAVET